MGPATHGCPRGGVWVRWTTASLAGVPTGVLRDDRHRRLRGSTPSPGSRGASAQAPGPAPALLGPRSLGSLVSAPRPYSGLGPGPHAPHCNTAMRHSWNGEPGLKAQPSPSPELHGGRSPQVKPYKPPAPVPGLQRPPYPMRCSHALGPAPAEALGGADRGDVGV